MSGEFSEREVRMKHEVKELRWRNGKPQLGTLESILEQATAGIAGAAVADQPSFVSWLTGEMNVGSMEGSCSGDGERERKKARRWSSPENTWEFCGGMSSSLSPENLSSGDGCDSLPWTKSSQGVEEIEKKKKNKKVIRRRWKAAAIHNQSERKRRDRINQKIKALQKLVPNSCKTDKASMLDEVIKYLKQLQNQVQMMTMPNLQMTMMAQMAQMTQMGLGLGPGFMNLGSFVRPGTVPMQFAPLYHPLTHPSVLPNSFYMQQSMNMEAYEKMAAMYQQLNQQQNKVNPEN